MSFLSDITLMGQLYTGLSLFVRNKDLPKMLADNKWVSVFGIWLGGSMVRSTLTKTGAFEVYLGQKRVWSSIEKGVTPKLKDLVESFKKVGVTIKA